MTSTELVSELQAYVDACSGITLYDGHPAVLIAKARDAITTLERELDEAQLAASVIEGICNEMDLELTASQAQVERLKAALKPFGQILVYSFEDDPGTIILIYDGQQLVALDIDTAEGSALLKLEQELAVARAALQVEESNG